jgi:hypothetical protein
MCRVACGLVVLLMLPLTACVSPYFEAKLGRISGSLATVWVGEEKFVYVPARSHQTLKFETATTGRLIEPGLMYTDGGSIPRFAQVLKGFSPWGYGPAYIIHDWVFYGHHCYLDRGLPNQNRYADARRFADVNGDPSLPHGHPRRHAVTFHESALILAEVVKTLIDYGQVQPRSTPGELISAAVDSPLAAAIWDREGACTDGRVEPRHIAIVWLRTYGDMDRDPPRTWKLSAWEIQEARKHQASARRFLESVNPMAPPPRQPARAPTVAQAN